MANSGGLEADGVDEAVEVVNDPLVEPIELRSAFRFELGVAGHGMEQAGGERRVDALEEFQEQ